MSSLQCLQGDFTVGISPTRQNISSKTKNKTICLTLQVLRAGWGGKQT